MLKQLIRLNTDDLLAFGGILGGIFLLVQAILTVVMLTRFPCDAIMISGMLLMVAAVIMAFFSGTIHVFTTFVQAVQFSQTRQRALGLTLGVIGTECLFLSVLSGVLGWIEWNLCPRWWMLLTGADGYAIAAGNGYPVVRMGDQSGVVVWIDSFITVDWWVTPLLIVLGGLAGLIVGALTQRFGRMGGWLVWGVWMAFVILFPRLPWRTHEVVDWLVPSLSAVALTALIWSVWSLLHAKITN